MCSGVAAKEFFKNCIKDNSLYDSKEHIDLTKGFLGRTLESQKEEVFKYLFLMAQFLKTIEPKEIVFADEYENTTKDVLWVDGVDYESLQISTGNIVGTIRYKGIEFNIHSRFGERFLMYMIASADGFLEYEDIGSFDWSGLLGEWLLVYLWKIKLKKAAALGMYKSYEDFSQNLSVVKGKIDFAKETFAMKRKLHCHYRDHAYDNEINYVIKLAFNKIFKKYNSILCDVGYLKRGFDEIRKPRNSKGVILNPFYRLYKDVYDLSLKILKGDFASIGENDFNAVLFDVSMLFEHHIRKLLKKKKRLEEKNIDEVKIPNGVGESRVYPDIVIKHDDDTISIFDVKYKNFDDRYGVEREDRFQLVSYVALYARRYTIKECGFIYPSFRGREPLRQRLQFCSQNTPFSVYFYNVYAGKENFSKNQKVLDERFLLHFC